MKNWRINSVLFIFFAILATITGRLFQLQITQGGRYKALSKGLHFSTVNSNGTRGNIFLKDGESLAINIDWPFLVVRPPEIENIEKTAEDLSNVIGLDKDFLLKSLEKDLPYLILARKLSFTEAESIDQLTIKGVYIEKELGRYYPQEEMASQIVGFLASEGEGQYGLEQEYNDLLDSEGGFLRKKQGSDLILTIDYNVQFQAEKILEQAKENFNIEDGQIIVVEPSSGKVLAMAHLLNFNPNYYEKQASDDLAIFKNKTTQELFEPGSVFKAITMAAAIEEEKVTPETKYVDEGSIKITGYPTPIYNYNQRVYGEQSMTNVLEKSINTGAVFAQKQLGQTLFLKYIERFGFLEPSGIDLGETYSSNEVMKKGREINFATASFGQGIEITPIQLIKSYCAIANGGKLINPYVVERTIDQNKNIKFFGEEVERKSTKILSSKTSSQLTAMLVSVTEKGFSQKAKIPGYFIAGKTGTAQVSFGALGINQKGYSEKTVQTFIGYAPAFNPQFLILVKLDNPETKTAEYSALPVFRELAEYILHQYQIPPDYE